IRGNNLSTFQSVKFKDEGFAFITIEQANELKTWAIQNDIIFTAAGTLVQVGYISHTNKYKKYIISNKQIRLRVNEAVAHPLFSYYWFSSEYIKDIIISRNTGSTIPLINL